MTAGLVNNMQTSPRNLIWSYLSCDYIIANKFCVSKRIHRSLPGEILRQNLSTHFLFGIKNPERWTQVPSSL